MKNKLSSSDFNSLNIKRHASSFAEFYGKFNVSLQTRFENFDELNSIAGNRLAMVMAKKWVNFRHYTYNDLERIFKKIYLSQNEAVTAVKSFDVRHFMESEGEIRFK